MSGHQRARRISNQSSAGNGTGAPLVAENMTLTAASSHSAGRPSASLDEALQAYLQANPPSVDDILLELQGNGLGKDMDSANKRKNALVVNVVVPFGTPPGKNVLSVISNFDIDLGTRLSTAIPDAKAVKRSSFARPNVARCMYNLYVLMKEFDGAIVNGSMAIRTQQQQQFWQSVYHDSIKAWVETAEGLAMTSITHKANALFVKIEGIHVRRRFCEDGFVWTSDPLALACVSCQHTYVDMPNECKNFQLLNEQKNAAYAAELADWEEKKGRGEKVARKPTAPKLLVRVKHCHCHQFHCQGNPIVTPTQCPIRCINPLTRQRYEMVDGKCQCPLCVCQCSVAIKVRMTAQLHLRSFLQQFLSIYCISRRAMNRKLPLQV